ncbi:MAG: HAD family hydrolase [Actinomycetota bacterium]|nr:HAD family hydrolase [Actinomycetota bacterium]
MVPSNAPSERWFIANPKWHSSQSQRGLLLDRDGVINLDIDFAHRQEDIVFIPGIFELCSLAVARGYLPIIITNQSGIGRGLFSEEQFRDLTLWMFDIFSAEGTELAGLYYCPTHPTSGVGVWKRESKMRKPEPGMFKRAIQDFRLSPELTIAIGDRPRDALAAARAGIGTNLLLGSSEVELQGEAGSTTIVIEDLPGAVPFLTLP